MLILFPLPVTGSGEVIAPNSGDWDKKGKLVNELCFLKKAFLILKRNTEEENIIVSWILFGEDMIIENIAAILF